MRLHHAVAAVFLLAACAKSPGAGPTVIIAATGDADVLLPPVTAVTTGINVSDLLFCRLAELKLALNTVDDSGFQPVLARSWEHPDSLTIVFHLDPRARWQDGVPVTAEDVVYTFGIYRDTSVNSPLAPFLEPIDSVTARDSLTVAFRFRRWYPEQLYDATYHMRILPRHLLDTIPAARLPTAPFGRAPVGDGPYRFVRWLAGSEIDLAADSSWFLGRPGLARLVWRVTPDLTAAVSGLLAGEADAIEVIPPPAELERVQRSRDLRLVPYPSPIYMAVVFNQRRSLFADRTVRRALAMAVDRRTIVLSVFGPFGQVSLGATSPMQWIWSDSIRQLPFDTAAAARALRLAGWRRATGGWRSSGGAPLRFTLLVPTSSRVRQQAATVMQDQLRRFGVELRILPLEFTVMEQQTRAGDFDAAFVSRTIDPSPASLLQWWSPGAADNIGRFADPTFQALAAAASRARTRAAAAPLWREALGRLNDEAPALFLFSPRNHAAISARLSHVTIRPDSWLATVTAWQASGVRPGAPDRSAARP